MAAIESPSNPLIRQIGRSLEERTHLLLEGEKAILDAVAAGASLDHVLHDDSVRPGRLALLTSTRPRLVSRAVIERLAESRTPQHLIAVARRRDVPSAEILGRPGPVVFVFGIQDPGNLGAIVRVAEAAGAAGVVGAVGSADFFHPRAVRGSAGSVLRVPVSGKVSFEPFAASAREAGRTICGAVS
ncbi:MAG TPA: TrmH family RNA methyltransferase, partial [Thermoanaerobaculia bacterium]